MVIRRILADFDSLLIVHMSKPLQSARRLSLLAIVGAISLISTASLEGCSTQDLEVQAAREQRPFFQSEQETETHGRKNWLDRLIEVDPGKLEVEMVSDYQEHAPGVIAVMPFCDNEFPLTRTLYPERRCRFRIRGARRLNSTRSASWKLEYLRLRTRHHHLRGTAFHRRLRSTASAVIGGSPREPSTRSAGAASGDAGCRSS